MRLYELLKTKIDCIMFCKPPTYLEDGIIDDHDDIGNLYIWRDCGASPRLPIPRYRIIKRRYAHPTFNSGVTYVHFSDH